MHTWYERRVRLATDWLAKQQLMSPQVQDNVQRTIETLLSRVSISELTPIHGDLIEHNLFVEIGGGVPRISGLRYINVVIFRQESQDFIESFFVWRNSGG